MLILTLAEYVLYAISLCAAYNIMYLLHNISTLLFL